MIVCPPAASSDESDPAEDNGLAFSELDLPLADVTHADLGAGKVHHDPEGALEGLLDLPDVVDGLLMIAVGAVREVDTRTVHPGARHLFDHLP